MRPVRLELHGFTTFREEAVVDFEGADLFALAGPTGSGKSSIIDGMCFALYGSIPRLDGRTVEPVISTGKVEARIRFDFTVGERTYTAVRVVRRLAKGGASTKEARLEHDGQTLAGDARGMTDAVEALLGLGFEQFTKSVVLPQGDFARFLHDTPSGRQELLVKLLELGVYDRMRAAANTRKVVAESAIELTSGQLARAAHVTPEAVAAAGARVEVLTALRAEIDEAQPQLDDLVRRRDEQRAAADAAEAAVGVLAGVAAPAGLNALADEVTAAEKELLAAAAQAETGQRAVTDAEAARGALGDAAAVQRLLDAHEQRTTLTERIAIGGPKVADAREAESAAAAAVDAAATAVRAAADALERARLDHAAHALAATLVAGEPCPVCEQTVSAVGTRPAPAALADAEAAHESAVRAHDAARAALTPLQEQRAKWQHSLASLEEQLTDIAQRLAQAPTVEALTATLDAIRTADAALAAARHADSTARTRLANVTAAAQEARRRRDGAWAAFDQARDAVAAFAPPTVAREDLAAAWTTLVSWAAEELARRRAISAAAREAVTVATNDLQALQSKLAARCDECAVVVRTGTRARDAVADAVAAAQAQARRLEEELEQVQLWRLEVAAHQERADVAKELVSHLSSRGFEQWLLDEALGQLADGASEILRELSSGQYSLTLDQQRNFLVIDHRSADEQRPARTLSGGETFLASLSLALTLADHLGQLAVDARPRLESIFLDEGFGTLDPETLDTVTTAIEELGATGRTVGIVTHVRDLAERMPVRFDVRKGPVGSTVERVEQ